MSKQEYKKAVKNHGTTILVIVAALVFTVSIVVIKKSYDNFAEYRELNQHETQVLETLETNRKNLEQLQARAEELTQEGLPPERAVSLVPLRYYPVADFAAIEQLADISGIQLQNIRISESTGTVAISDRLTPYQITVSVTGSYSEIKKFYANIEESAQPLIVKKVSINSEAGGVEVDGEGSSSNSITSDVKIILHHQGGGGTAGDGLEGGTPGEDVPGEGGSGAGIPENGEEVLE